VSTPERESPRRLRAADVIEAQQHVIDQLTTRPPSEPSASVEITRNAAGNAQFTVKSYAPSNAGEAEVKAAMENAFAVASDAFEAMNALYPHVDPKAAK